MNQTSLIAVGLVLSLAAACSSSSDDHAPPAETGGESGSGTAAGAAGRGKSGSGPVADAGSDAGGTAGVVEGGAAGVSSDAGAAGIEPGMIIDVPPSACSETAKWSGAMQVPVVSTGADERLLAITLDELDIVFLRGTDLYAAHRAAAGGTFAAASQVTVPTGYDATLGVALSVDGKTMVLVASTGQAFGSVTRASRTAAFGSTVDSTAFQGLNQRAIQTLERYVSPVLAPDGSSLVFGAFMPEPTGGFPQGQEGVSVVYESRLANGAWSMPNNLSHDLFDGTTLARPLPTGLSGDSRTLFYFDEKSMKEQARFRDRPDAPLYTLVDLGARTGAMPNAACSALYYTSAGNVLIDSK